MKTFRFSFFIIFSLLLLACKQKEQKPSLVVEVIEKSGLTVGDTIPEYLGLNEDSVEIKSSDFKGKKLVLYFYPKDYTPGCTAQACSLRDNYDALLNDGYAILGVSSDGVSSHKSFKKKENLPFSLIADTDRQLMKKFGAIKEATINGEQDYKTLRMTFVIDENGVIQKIISPEEVETQNHAMQILQFNNTK